MQEMTYNEIDLETNIPDEDFVYEKKILDENINYNQIDMECEVPDDYYEDSFILKDSKTKVEEDLIEESNSEVTFYGYCADFSDDTNESSIELEEDYLEEEFEPELTSEELLIEKKSKTIKTQGEVEKDYWDKLSKKHSKSNVKGSYNTSFHFCGNPEKEMELFNNSVDISNTSFANDSSSISCSENINKKEKNTYQKLFEDLLLITGFSLNKDDEGNYEIKDLCNSLPTVNCKNKEEILNSLNPYIQDTFIFPLQITTGETYNDYSDWCNWYNDEMKEKFPKCQSDIKYCDLIANHLDDVTL